MAIRKSTSKINDKAWLDWLSNDPPAAGARAELRERAVRQANTYQPRPLQPPAEPAKPEPKPDAKAAQPATVSIQIHIPALQTEKFHRVKDKLLDWLEDSYQAVRSLIAANRRRSLIIALVTVLVLVGLFVPPLVLGKHGKGGNQGGAAAGSSAGAATSYAKPPFDVVVPSSKPKLATPDGVHSAYDGKRNTYSFSDNIGGDGFIVSQQPIPSSFKGGQDAVTKIGPTLGDSTPVKISTLFGEAYIATNPKTSAQSVVVSVRDLLVFMQSAHDFKDSEWVTYINALQ